MEASLQWRRQPTTKRFIRQWCPPRRKRSSFSREKYPRSSTVAETRTSTRYLKRKNSSGTVPTSGIFHGKTRDKMGSTLFCPKASARLTWCRISVFFPLPSWTSSICKASVAIFVTSKENTASNLARLALKKPSCQFGRQPSSSKNSVMSLAES